MKHMKLILTTLFLITLSAQLLGQSSINRTPWEMNRGGSWSYLNFSLPSHGYPGNWDGNEYDETTGAYANANIPATSDPNWGPAPNGETIGFSESSILPGNCLSSVDYTYFQTFVNVPTNTNVTQFNIVFSSIDDGGRITIFNDTYQNGVVVAGSYFTLSGGGSADLSDYVTTGQNRVVVTQVDDCPTGNNLHSAVVVLNGSTVETCSIGDEQTFTILGANGTVGDIDSYTDVSLDGGQTWEPAYLSGPHQWGLVSGTTHWVGIDSDMNVGSAGDINYGTGWGDTQNWVYADFRIQFTIPEDFSNASMVFDVKADNEAEVFLNGEYVQHVYGQNGTAVDASISEALQPGLNEIILTLGDYGGIWGINYRIDVTMTSCEDLTDAVEPSEYANEAPTAYAGGDQILECDGGGADLTLDGSGSSDPDEDALTYSWNIDYFEIATGESPTVNLGLGTHFITLTVDDGNGKTDTDEVEITVEDTKPPEITVADPIALWPPNHKYRTVTVSDFVTSISDVCDSDLDLSAVIITSVTSDEEEDASGGKKGKGNSGDGNTLNDIVIGDYCQTVDLRAERQGGGNGRVYTVHVSATDASGNVGEASFQVQVPHNKKNTATDDGSVYTVVSGDCDPLPPSQAIKTVINDDGDVVEEIVPTGFTLKQNYPNPFNPSTTLSYATPNDGYVTLKVYNLLGIEVASLVSGYQPAGHYQVRFDASNLSAGTYLYVLQAGAHKQVKKMIFLK